MASTGGSRATRRRSRRGSPCRVAGGQPGGRPRRSGLVDAVARRRWRQGRIEKLAGALTVSPAKPFGRVAPAGAAGARPRTGGERDGIRRPHARSARVAPAGLRRTWSAPFSTHWLSPELSVGACERLARRQSRQPELVVTVALDWTCTACGEPATLPCAPIANRSQPRQWFWLVRPVFGAHASATGCHWLRPLGSRRRAALPPSLIRLLRGWG